MSNEKLNSKLVVKTFYKMELQSNVFEIEDNQPFTIPIELHIKKIQKNNSNLSMEANPSGMIEKINLFESKLLEIVIYLM